MIYHGSEYKDHIVWSAASKIQHLIGATNAFAFETYALCAGAPIAYKVARDMMRVDERLQNVLLVSASRENDLIDFSNPAHALYVQLWRGRRRDDLPARPRT